MKIFLLVLLVILLIALAVILIFFRKSKNENDDEVKINPLGKGFNMKYFRDMRLVTLPHKITLLSTDRLREIAKDMFHVYTLFDYRNNEEEYKKDVWHSWQVSVLIALYSKDAGLYIPDCTKYFNNDVLNMKLDTLEIMMKKYLKKYKKHVNVNLSEEILSKNLLWSAEEVSIMMYYLYTSKNK